MYYAARNDIHSKALQSLHCPRNGGTQSSEWGNGDEWKTAFCVLDSTDNVEFLVYTSTGVSGTPILCPIDELDTSAPSVAPQYEDTSIEGFVVDKWSVVSFDQWVHCQHSNNCNSTACKYRYNKDQWTDAACRGNVPRLTLWNERASSASSASSVNVITRNSFETLKNYKTSVHHKWVISMICAYADFP